MNLTEPILIKAGDGRVRLGEYSEPPSVDCRVVAELQYQRLLERSRIEGVLLGLALAKKAWDKNLGREDIAENEMFYREELAKL